jgi:hypothetical protein
MADITISLAGSERNKPSLQRKVTKYVDRLRSFQVAQMPSRLAALRRFPGIDWPKAVELEWFGADAVRILPFMFLDTHLSGFLHPFSKSNDRLESLSHKRAAPL